MDFFLLLFAPFTGTAAAGRFNVQLNSVKAEEVPAEKVLKLVPLNQGYIPVEASCLKCT